VPIAAGQLVRSLSQPIENWPSAIECRVQFDHQVARAVGVPVVANLFETRRQEQHFVCANGAGNTHDGVRGALERLRVVRGSCTVKRLEPSDGLFEKAGDDARYGVWPTRPLHFPQRQKRRDVDSLLHSTV
jgi:hypothetical protein